MKQFLALICFALTTTITFAKKVEVNEAILTDSHSWDLEYIEIHDNYTLCKWKVSSLTPNTYVCMSKNVYLEDAISGKKFFVKEVEGIPYEPEKEIIIPQYGYVDFIVKFEPLPQRIDKIHYMGSSFQIRDIELNKKEPDIDSMLGKLKEAAQYANNKNHSAEIKIYKELADKGLFIAQYNLAMSYYKGIGVPRDMAQTAFWAKKSAQSGFSDGCLFYANLCFEGIGVKRNLVESAKWMLKAAELGNVTAQGYMGMNYENGDGVIQDYAEAAKWYRKAAEKGMSAAANNLAHLYAVGKGVEVNFSEAGRWFLFAAEGGDVNAQYTIGIWYFYGYQGWPQNKKEGLKWIKLAANNGDTNAKIKLAEIDID